VIILKLLKQLKKKLRRKLRWLSLGLFGLIVATFVLTVAIQHRASQQGEAFGPEAQSVFLANRMWSVGTPQQAILDELKREARAREVFVRKMYICGEEIRQIGTLSPNEVEQLLVSHPQAEIALQGDEQLVVSEKVDGLSTACQDGAYFGVDEGGTLSLFNGLPERNKVIRTFFQLNIQFLKSALPSETVDRLYKGILVMDRDEYNSVLSTFADYALTNSERASAPAHPGESGESSNR
jgi:forespore regulator of the sigma-K checkpoint